MVLSWEFVQKKHSLNKIKFDDYFKHIGRPFKDILSKLGIKKNKDAIKKTYQSGSISNINNILYFKNTIETLKKLKRRKILLSIVTSKDNKRTRKFLNKNIGLFSYIECDDSKSAGKPNPAKINKIIKYSKARKHECVYIGDTNIDYNTAKNAKIDFIFAKWGYGVNYNYKYKCNKIENILKMIV